MTYKEAVQIMPEDDRARATLYAINALLLKRGIYTEYEFENLITTWAKSAYREHTPLAWITASVARFYGVNAELLRKGSKRPAEAFPRQIAMYLCHALTDNSWAQIGRFFHKHHTTVIYSVDVIAARREVDSHLNAFIRETSNKFAEEWETQIKGVENG